MSTDDLTTARAFGLAARVADLEDQLAKLRHYHFSTRVGVGSELGAAGGASVGGGVSRSRVRGRTKLMV